MDCMTIRNFSSTADYFDRRASKARSARRRTQLESAARLYRDKSRTDGEQNGGDEILLRSERRDRLAAIFRKLGDPESIARSYRREQRDGQM
jgi:hypothetical protein